METKNNALGLCNYAWRYIVKDYPELEGSTSLSHVAKVIFGVKSLTGKVKDYNENNVTALKAFFGADHSSLIDWAKHSKYLSFYAIPSQLNAYRLLIRDLGLPLAVKFTQDRDFSDLLTGWNFIKADKKRLKKFRENIIEALPIFPASAHSKMIHDYIVELMKREERKGKPTLGLEPTLPHLPLPEMLLGYRILVPRNDSDLRKIGTAQNHCVGTKGMGYANKIRSGRVNIFALYKNSLSDGLCIEVTQEGNIVQAQGRYRRGPDLIEAEVLNEAIKLLVA